LELEETEDEKKVHEPETTSFNNLCSKMHLVIRLRKFVQLLIPGLQGPVNM
jgi:hypothetical protein